MKYVGKATHGPPFVNTVTSWPAASTWSIAVSAAPVSGLSRQLSMLNFTAAPSSGVPSWNLMPSRMCIVHCV